MNKTTVLTLGVLFAIATPRLQAQPTASDSLLGPWSYALAFGGQNYLGDLLPSQYNLFGASADFSFSVKAHAEYNLMPYLRLRAGYLGSTLQGEEGRYAEKNNEAWRKDRALRFSSPVHEVSFSVLLEPLRLLKREQRSTFRSSVMPYLGVGIGYAFVNPVVGDTLSAYKFAVATGNSDHYNRDLHRSPIKGTFVVPVTLGIAWQVTPHSAVFGEASRHYTMTDYLDGVANWNGEAKNDGYINYALGYRYTLGRNN